MSGRNITDEVKDKVPVLRSQGYTLDKVARELGVSRRTVSRVLNPLKSDERKKWRRENVIHTTINGKGGWHRVKKRPLPENCELCDKPGDKLMWHHWDPEKPELGIWVHPSCHYFVEAIEKGLGVEHVIKYLDFKHKEDPHDVPIR